MKGHSHCVCVCWCVCRFVGSVKVLVLVLVEVTREKFVWLVRHCCPALVLFISLSVSLDDTFQGVHSQLILYFLCNILNIKN